MKNVLLLVLGLIFSMYVSGQSIAFSENFELTTTPDSVTSTSSTTNAWGISSFLQHGGLRSDSCKVGFADTCKLTTNSFSTAGNGSVILSFWHICKIEWSDAAYVDVSNDNGLTWVPLVSTQYLGSGQFGAIGNKFNSTTYPVDWDPSNNNTVPSNSWWKQETFDISALVGNSANVKVRFRLIDGAPNNGNGGAAGWFIDDILVTKAANELVPPAITINSVYGDTVFNTGPFLMNTSVTDASGILKTGVVYKVNYTGTFDTVFMTKTTGNNFEGSVPSKTFNNRIIYYFFALDSFLNLTTTPYDTFLIKEGPSFVTIGHGTVTNTSTSYPTPFGNYYWGNKDQYIIRASELQAAGMGSQITGLAFDVTATNGCAAHQNFYIKIGTTTATAATTTFITTGLTQVYSNASYMPVVGWNDFVFSTPFNWDGSSNLVIEVCSNNSSYVTNASVNQTTTTYASTANSHSDNATVCTAPATPTTYNQRPNIRFSIPPDTSNYDAGVASISSPSGVQLTNVYLPLKLSIKSFGNVDLNKATINWSLDGVLKTPHIWTGVLQKAVTSSVLLIDSCIVTQGQHTIKAWTSLPNDSADQNHNNDTVTKTFFACNSILNGTYTIGGSGADFPTFSAALALLQSCGVGGPVTFNIASGVYTETIDITSIPGVSAVNTITFKSANNDSNSVILKNTTGVNYILKITSADYIKFQGVTFDGSALPLGSTPVNVYGAKYTTFKSCIVKAITNSTNYNDYGIYAQSGFSYLTVENCYITGGYYGLYLYSTTTARAAQTKVINSKIEDFYYYGAYFYYNDTITFSGNYMINRNTATYGYGLQVYYSNGNATIMNNKIYGRSIYYFYPMYLYTIAASSTQKSVIANNFVSCIAGSGGNYGVYMYGVNNVDFVNNSFNIPNGDVNSRCVYMGSNSGVTFMNNTLSNTASGYAMYVSGATFDRLNYNNYYSNGTFGYFNTAVSNLAAWQTASSQDTNSVSLNPYYTSTTDLHTSEIGLYKKGKYQAVAPFDIDGQVRDTVNVCIGADEFPVFAKDAGILSIVKPSAIENEGTNLIVKALLKNYGADTLFTTSIKYRIDNGTAVPYTYNGSLIAGGIDTVNLPNLSVPSGPHTIYVWTELANDAAHSNDSLSKAFYGDPLHDLRVVQIIRPYATDSASISRPVTVRVKNDGTLPIYGANLYYVINQGSSVGFTFNDTILPNAFKNFDMPNLLIPKDSNLITVYGELTGDGDKTNDTLRLKFYGKTANDAEVRIVYSLSQMPKITGAPYKVRAVVRNTGYAPISNHKFYLTISGANTFNDTITKSFALGQQDTLTFNGFTPSSVGTCLISVSGQSDSNNINNAATFSMLVTDSIFSYATATNPTNYLGFTGAAGMVLNKYKINGAKAVHTVTAYLNGAATIGQTIYGVVLDSNGTKICQSPNKVITASDTATWISFQVYDSSKVFLNEDIYVGVALVQGASNYFPVGVQAEVPVRAGSFYYRSGLPGTGKPIDGASLNFGRQMINAHLVPPPPYSVAAVAVSAPAGGCGLGNEQVKLKIKNEGTEIISTGLTASYKELSASTAVTETVNVSIQPGTVYEYTFTSPINLTTSVDDTFFVRAWVSLASDPIKTNDTTLYKLIPSFVVPSAPLGINAQVQYATSDTVKAIPANTTDSLHWFLNPIGGQSVKDGKFYKTPVLFDTTVYYVEAGGTRIDTITLGTGTIVNGNTAYPAPYGNWYWGAKHQMLILASELIAQNVTAGPINSLAFDVSSVNSCPTLNANEIKIKHTTSTAVTTTFETGLTSVYTNASYMPINGWNVHTFSTPFMWDGVSNLIVEYCFNNSSYVSAGNASFNQSSTTFPSTVYFNTDAATVCPTTTAYTVINQRPNIKLSAMKGGGNSCSSPRIPVYAYVINIPANDCGVDSIVSPTSNPPAFVNQNVVVLVKNYGSANLTSATVNYSVDGVPQTPVSWTGSIPHAGHATVSLGVSQFGAGSHVIKAWAVNANGQGNTYAINDTLTKNIYSCITTGTYLISKTNPNASFTTFAGAVSALVNCGISGPVTFNVDTATYNEQITIPQIVGASSVNTITFKAVGDSTKTILSFSSTSATDNFVIKMNGADYVSFQRFTIRNTGASYASVIEIGNGSNYNSFINNLVSSVQGANSNNRCVYSSGGLDEYNLFKNNTFRYGYYNIYMVGISTTSKERGNQFIGNRVLDYNYYGCYLYYQDSMQFKGNYISSDPTGNYGYGMYMYYNDKANIIGNQIVCNAISYHYAMYVYYCHGTATTPVVVANNFITAQTGTGANYGIYAYYSDTVDYLFNSVRINSGTTTGRALYQYYGSRARFLNNNFTNFSSGYAAYYYTPAAVYENDNNNYYTNGVNLAYWNGDKTNLAALKTANSKDLNSISVDPLFTSSSNLHVMNPFLNAKGIPAGDITTDIDGETRNVSTPDIGADEFTPSPIDMGAVALVSPITSGCFSAGMTVKVRVMNMGTDTIYFTTIPCSLNVSVTGINPITFPTTIINTGYLAPLSTMDVVVSSNYNMSASGTYVFSASTNISGDGNALNNAMQSVNMNVTSVINNYPYTENFENFTTGAPGVLNNGWSRDANSTFVWYVNNGATSSSGTGPSVDHTTGNTVGKYVFSEASYGLLNDYANITSPCLNLTSMSNPVVKFWYHMNGADCKAIYVYGLDTLGNWVIADSLMGPSAAQPLESSPWLQKSVNLSNFTHGLTKVRFRAVKGSSFYGDMALDDIYIDQPEQFDLAVKTILKPNKPFGQVGSTDSVSIKVQNYGWDTVNSFTIGYSYNGGTPITVTLPYTLYPDSFYIYSFSTPFTIASGLHQLATFVHISNDTKPSNDTLKMNYQGLSTFSPEYMDDFEGPVHFTPGSNNSLWQYGVTTSSTINSAHSPSHIWKTNLSGNYIDNMEDYLYTPYFDFSNISYGATLKFWHWVDVQANSDACQLQYSTNGTSWSSLGYISDPNATNWYTVSLGGIHVWSASSTGWMQSTYDLAQFNNSTSPIQFRFKFSSNASISSYDGWAIDDFKIELPKIPHDAGVISIVQPVATTPIASNVHVKVAIKNYGLLKLDTIPVAYRVNALAAVQDTFYVPSPGLQPNAVDTFAFNLTYTGPATSYKLCAWTTVVGDVYIQNDSACSMLGTSPALTDVAVTQIISPTGQTKYTHHDSVKIMVVNFGMNPISNIPVEYKVNSSIKSSDTIAVTMNHNDTVYYTFKQPYSGIINQYNLCAYSKVTNDANPANDMTCNTMMGINDVGMDELSNAVFNVSQNEPNPARNNTVIAYELPSSGKVTFELRNILGQVITSSIEEKLVGSHQMNLNTANLTAGVYYYTFEFNKQRITKKLIVNK